LLSALQPLLQLEQLMVFAAGSTKLSVLLVFDIALTTANPPITSKPSIIEAIIHVFILTSLLI
jgi:hypothetical protein